MYVTVCSVGEEESWRGTKVLTNGTRHDPWSGGQPHGGSDLGTFLPTAFESWGDAKHGPMTYTLGKELPLIVLFLLLHHTLLPPSDTHPGCRPGSCKAQTKGIVP